MDFVFITYILALLALAIGIYAVLSLRDLEKRLSNRNNIKQVQQKKPLPPIKVERKKGHWD